MLCVIFVRGKFQKHRDVQRDECLRYAETNNLTPLSTIHDNLEAAIELLSAETVLLTHRADRISRRPEEVRSALHRIEARGSSVHVVQDPEVLRNLKLLTLPDVRQGEHMMTNTRYEFPGLSAASVRVARELLTDDNPTSHDLSRANYSGSFATVSDLVMTMLNERGSLSHRKHSARALSRALRLQEVTGGKYRPGSYNLHLQEQTRTVTPY